LEQHEQLTNTIRSSTIGEFYDVKAEDFFGKGCGDNSHAGRSGQKKKLLEELMKPESSILTKLFYVEQFKNRDPNQRFNAFWKAMTARSSEKYGLKTGDPYLFGPLVFPYFLWSYSIYNVYRYPCLAILATKRLILSTLILKRAENQ
jgi:hypothetical protein